MEFAASIEELFDIAHEDAMTMMVIEEDKQFLHLQRQGRKRYMGRITKNLQKENRKIGNMELDDFLQRDPENCLKSSQLIQHS